MLRKVLATIFSITLVSGCNQGGGSNGTDKQSIGSIGAQKYERIIWIPDTYDNTPPVSNLIISLLDRHVDVSLTKNLANSPTATISNLGKTDFDAPLGARIETSVENNHCLAAVDSNSKLDVGTTSCIPSPKDLTVWLLGTYSGAPRIFSVSKPYPDTNRAAYYIKNATKDAFRVSRWCGLYEQHEYIDSLATGKILGCSNGEKPSYIFFHGGSYTKSILGNELPDDNASIFIIE